MLPDTAFDRHTYKHTTMGFLKDIQDMPNQYEYSLKFFDRYYRPEYTTIVVVGDVKAKAVRELVDKYWGEWKRGSYKPEIPAGAAAGGAAHGPSRLAGADAAHDRDRVQGPGVHRHGEGHGRARCARLPGVLAAHSDLYQKLVIQEQKVDVARRRSAPSSVDPALFTDYGARQEGSRSGLRARPDSGDRQVVPGEAGGCRAAGRGPQAPALFGWRSRWIAATRSPRFWPSYVALQRTPETLNALYDQYAALTPEDVQKAAAKYLVENGPNHRHADAASRGEAANEDCSAAFLLLAAAAHGADSGRAAARQIAAGDVPVRVHDRRGVGPGRETRPRAHLTAHDDRRGRHEGPDVQTDRGRDVSHGVRRSSVQIDKEMTAFIGATHVDNLAAYYKLVRAHAAGARAGARTISRASRTTPSTPSRCGLRGNNDEELGQRSALRRRSMQGTPYGHYNYGHVSARWRR